MTYRDLPLKRFSYHWLCDNQGLSDVPCPCQSIRNGSPTISSSMHLSSPRVNISHYLLAVYFAPLPRSRILPPLSRRRRPYYTWLQYGFSTSARGAWGTLRGCADPNDEIPSFTIARASWRSHSVRRAHGQPRQLCEVIRSPPHYEVKRLSKLGFTPRRPPTDPARQGVVAPTDCEATPSTRVLILEREVDSHTALQITCADPNASPLIVAGADVRSRGAIMIFKFAD